jgi:peroxiredoxin
MGEPRTADDFPLKAHLDAFREDWTSSAPPERVRVYEESIDRLRDSGVAQQALNVGDQAPAFELPNASGDIVSLAELLKRGPVVLTWYRGGWCPYCNIALYFWQKEALSEIEALGGTLVAISPETPDNSLTTTQKNNLKFEVLSDAGNKVARDYGLVFKLPDEVLEQMRGRIDLNNYYGDQQQNELPIPATYLINTAGVIRFALVDPDYRKRAEPADVIRALRQLKQD